MGDVTEEEIEAELGVIRTQHGYALQKLGKDKEALQLYNGVIKGKYVSVYARNNVTYYMMICVLNMKEY